MVLKRPRSNEDKTCSSSQHSVRIASKEHTDNHNSHGPIKQRRPRRRAIPRVQAFRNLEVAHPYGILPAGNLFTDGASGKTETSFFANNDSVCHAILSFCNGTDLGRISQTCRFLYAAAHQPELWRDLVLRKADTTVQTLDCMSDQSWKDTYVRLTLLGNDKAQRKIEFKAHQPMAVFGIYSDDFYRLHSCRMFAFPPAWLEEEPPSKHSVARVPCAEMTPERFFRDFEQPNRPVVLQQAAAQWKATKQWTLDYLLQQTEGRTFRATSGAAPLPAQFTLKAYHEYCQWPILEEAPLYLFDRTALAPNSPLWHDYIHDLHTTCPFWDDAQCPEHDLFALLGEGRRPDHTWLIAGPKRSGSVFHMDPNATHAWNAAIKGRKRWIFYPPGVPPPGVHPSADADQVALPLTVGEWIFQFWDEHVERMLRPNSPEEQPLEITAFPGDVIFVPHGWWHMVINLDEDMNVAITHNYVSESNLDNVLKFLSLKRDQVSGCRDRSDSIKPDHLYEEFVKVMEQRHPKWLKDAREVPDWTCRAWSNNQNESSTDEGDRRKGDSDNKPSLSIMTQAKPEESSGFSFSFL